MPKPREFRYVAIVRLIHLGLIGVFCLLFIVTALFVYRSVFTTIGEVEAIMTLETDLRIEPIDFDRLQTVESRWTAKHAPAEWSMPRNPFTGVARAATTTPALEPVATDL